MNNIKNEHLYVCVSDANFDWYLIIVWGHHCHQLHKSALGALKGSGHIILYLPSSNTVCFVPCSLYFPLYLGLYVVLRLHFLNHVLYELRSWVATWSTHINN